MQERYLLSVTLVFLAITLASLAYRAGRRRGYGPLLAGTAAAVVIVVGKFSLGWDSLVYFGIAALILASGWNVWPRSGTNNVPPAVDA